MADKAVTTYSKEYVTKRIEARITSLRATIARSDLTIAAWWTQIEETLDKVFDVRTQQAQQFAIDLDKMAAAWEAARNPREKYEALAALNSPKWETPPYLPSGRNKSYASEVEKAIAAKENAEREIMILEHTVAYFTDTPVEDFTLTSLQKLGLLDAIKFTMPEKAAS